MSIFSKVKVPKRTRKTLFNLSHEKKLTGNMGKLYPVLLQEIVPGDEFRVKSEVFIRFAPLIAPIMHRIDVFVHYFYVPNRIIWSNWEKFITGGETGDQEPEMPHFVASEIVDKAQKGSLADYLGIPPLIDTAGNGRICSLPFRAYQLIYDEYYRDQNLESKKVGKLEIIDHDGKEYTDQLNNLLDLRRRNWQKDYFTSALPWSQKGGEAVLPITNQATWTYKDGSDLTDGTGSPAPNGSLMSSNGKMVSDLDTNTNITIDNLADIDITASNIDINDLRKAYKLQLWLERNARAGSRYIESILAHFGVKVPDSRLQRPEYLGGGKQPVSVSDVLSTFGTEGNPQGNPSGQGISVGMSNAFKRRFTEHGYVIGILSVMPKPAYMNGLQKLWRRFDKFDFYFPEFANLGEQEILKSELFFNGNNAEGEKEVFGYTPRYAEYKYVPDSVHGEFRDTFKYWHLAREFNDFPELNESFIRANVRSDIFAVNDDAEDHLWIQVFNNVRAKRPMPYFGTPGW